MKKLNRTKEELAEMNRIRRKKYYKNHKEEESKKNLKRYYGNKVVTDGETSFTSSVNNT